MIFSSVKKMFLEITQSSQKKTCAWACNFIKKRLKTPFLQNISGRLLLQQLSWLVFRGFWNGGQDRGFWSVLIKKRVTIVLMNVIPKKTCAWACNFIKKRLKTPFLQNISGRLLLQQLSWLVFRGFWNGGQDRGFWSVLIKKRVTIVLMNVIPKISKTILWGMFFYCYAFEDNVLSFCEWINFSEYRKIKS